MLHRDRTVKFPSFPVPRILKTRDRLYEFLELYAGRIPRGDVFARLREAVGAGAGVAARSDAVAETVRALPPAPLTRRALWEFSWRIAGNLATLRRGEAVRPWSGQSEREWVPVEIAAASYRRHERHGLRCELQLRVLAGTPCPMTIAKVWPAATVNRRAEALGFTRRGRKKLPFADCRQLVRLRFIALLDPELTREAPGYADWAVPPFCHTWNRKLLLRRIFREPPCPEGFSHACHNCPVGYAAGEKTCPAAVHPATWEYGHCVACDRDAWFDPAAGGDFCLECSRAASARAGD